MQLGCHPVAAVILHVYNIWNWLLLNLIGRATWEACSGNLESWEPSQHLLIGTEKRLSRWPVAGPSEYWLLTSSPASKEEGGGKKRKKKKKKKEAIRAWQCQQIYKEFKCLVSMSCVLWAVLVNKSAKVVSFRKNILRMYEYLEMCCTYNTNSSNSGRCRLVGRHNTKPQKKATCVAPKFSSWHTDS